MADNLSPGATGLVRTVDESLITYTNVVYALHSIALLIGITTAATIVGSFIGGIPSIIAVIMNYARRSETRGTFLESHFKWQIRTFWFTVLWALIIAAVSLPLAIVLIGFILFPACFGVLAIWVIYRIVRGWLALRDRRPMYS
jgi:uncharacterized membrane protein